MSDFVKKRRVLLVGNPNCGKSTLFNIITGAKMPVGNFSGVTVEVYQGKAKLKFDAFESVVCDLPGLYSLNPAGEDERVAAREIEKGDYDFIINVVDGTNLLRHGQLTVELAKLGKPMAVAITMADILKKRGVNLDTRELSRKLGGVPVFLVNAKSGLGIRELFKAVANSGGEAAYGRAIGSVSEIFGGFEHQSPEKDRAFKADKVFLHPVWGVFSMVITFAGVFYITFGCVGSFCEELLSGWFAAFTEWVRLSLWQVGAAEFLQSLVCDGILAGVLGVLVFLPQLAILYVAIAALEDSGLMARFSYLSDPLLSKIGLSGKAAIPMIMGFGCTVPALTAAKTADTPKGRFLTLCIVPFIPCSARLPIIFYIAGRFFGGFEVPICLALYIAGVAAGALLLWIISKCTGRGAGTKVSGEVPFLLELPPYRVPSVSSVISKTFTQLKHFICKAATVIFLLSIAMWTLEHFSPSLMYVGDCTEESILYAWGRVIAPMFKPLGFGEPELVISLITGVAAKEAVVSTLAVFESSGFVLTEALTKGGAAAFLCFVAMYTPCIAAIATLKKELGGAKKAAVLLTVQAVLAYLAAACIYFVSMILSDLNLL